MLRAREVVDQGAECDSDLREAFALRSKSDTSRAQEWLDAVAKDDPVRAFRLIVKMAAFIADDAGTSADVH